MSPMSIQALLNQRNLKQAYNLIFTSMRPLHERGAREKRDEIWLIEAEIAGNT